MSSKVLSIGLTLVSFALMAIPGVGTALGIGMQVGLGLGITVAQAIGFGIAIAGSFLLGPAKPKGLGTNPADRLFANLDTTTPRKICFGGPTALATDIRYQSFSGSNQEYIHQIICVASHAVQSIDEIWLDNELAWTLAGGAQGRYGPSATPSPGPFIWVTPILEGTSANGIAIDSTWTAQCTLTGCAYVHIKYKTTDRGGETNSSPFAGGVTNRITIRGKGAKVYDPRLDSTVAGGSGSQRADDQTTWAWSDSGSRNPALQELFYELGWKINGKLAVGKGVPKARIDLASYAVAANVCDENVTLAAGGTEPRYRSDGVCSEGDDPGAIRDNLCATMNAVLRDAGGRLSLEVIVNDLATPVTPQGKSAFDAHDIIGEIEWSQTPDLSSTFNIVRGRRIDPSDNALYQMVDVPEVSVTSPDGIARIDTYDLPFVQSNGQAQRLFKMRLMRNQYQGMLSFVGKPSFWSVSLGDVFPFTHAAFGWTAKLFRCAGQKISRSGETEIVAIEENAAIYTWTAEDAPAVTVPSPPKPFNPLNDPIIAGTNQATRDTARINSYPNPGSVLSAADAGTTATITIASHTRVYPIVGGLDLPDVAITGGAIAGLAFSTRYYVYYDDTTLSSTTPTFQATTVSASAQVGAATGRHFVGFITTPADGAGGTSGQGGAPPGGGGGGDGGQIV